MSEIVHATKINKNMNWNVLKIVIHVQLGIMFDFGKVTIDLKLAVATTSTY